MAKKSMRNLAKIAAGLGAAYALSKMGKTDSFDGTEGVFEQTESFKGKMAPSTAGRMDGTEGTFPASAKPKRGSVEAFRQAESERQSRIAALKSGAPKIDRSAFNAKVKAINEARTGMKNPRYKKGGSVHVKTKIGYSKPTKIC